MRAIVLLIALAAAGCATPTLEELETEALRTGNWEAVKKREAVRQKRNGSSSSACPKWQTKFCVDSGFQVRCHCVASRGIR